MAGLKKLDISTWNEWLVISKWVNHQINVTENELVDAILNMPSSNDLLAKIQMEKKERYVMFQPEWFHNAPKSAQEKREKLKNTKWISIFDNNISYNTDWTLNIIKLNMTFSEDISWSGDKLYWEEAKEFVQSKWYRLGSDYGFYDSPEIRKSSDRYKVINEFSDGKWDIEVGREFFRDMAWCDGQYWTDTPYRDQEWVVQEDTVLQRMFDNTICDRFKCDTKKTILYVCGWKNMVA